MMKRFFYTLLCCLGVVCALGQEDTALVWRERYLDIYHFHTGRGNAAFFILPDGTTMLVDAGEIGGSFGQGQPLHIAPLYPNDSLTAGGWIAHYIWQVMPFGRRACIDYAVVTHFHADHYGNVGASSLRSLKGGYALSGITAVGDELPIRFLIDRGYHVPLDLRRCYAGDSSFVNYLSFIRYQVREHGMRSDSLWVGRKDQIRLVNRPGDFPDLSVLGIKCNATLYDPRSGGKVSLFDPAEMVSSGGFNENPLSLALLIRYGRFSYFTGGDNTGLRGEDVPGWFDVETPMAASVGRVEVCTFDHHGNRDAMNAALLRTLAPRVLVQQSWSSDHPGQELAHRLGSRNLYAGDRDVFATYIHPETKVTYGAWFVNAYKSMEGHVIIRVRPGGGTYEVLVAETVQGKLRVKGRYGPYAAK